MVGFLNNIPDISCLGEQVEQVSDILRRTSDAFDWWLQP